MAELSTIARPYAEAAFRLADESAALERWSASLGDLALVAEDPAVAALAGDPKVSRGRLAELVLGVLEGRLQPDAQNFLRLLVENGRLEALGEIRSQFEALKNAREGVQEVEIVSAFALEPAQQSDLAVHLAQHTGKKVNVHVTVDPELIGGVKIVMGDKVIDASARAQLAALQTALRS